MPAKPKPGISDSLLKQAWDDMPACVDVDPLATKTIDDLRWAARIQLDLIEEGQDGTEDDDPRPIRRWLKKYAITPFHRRTSMSKKKKYTMGDAAKPEALKLHKAEAPAEAPKDPPAKTKPVKAPKPSKEKKLSAIAAAHKVLLAKGEPMNCLALIDEMEKQKLWVSPGGATPHATLYSAILREINRATGRFAKGKDRGTFVAQEVA